MLALLCNYYSLGFIFQFIILEGSGLIFKIVGKFCLLNTLKCIKSMIIFSSDKKMGLTEIDHFKDEKILSIDCDRFIMGN